MPEVQHTRYIQGREYSRAKVCGHVVPNMSNGVPHLGLPYISTIGSPSGMYGRAYQIGTKVKYCSLPWTLPITRKVGGLNIKHLNWEHFPPVPCGT